MKHYQLKSHSFPQISWLKNGECFKCFGDLTIDVRSDPKHVVHIGKGHEHGYGRDKFKVYIINADAALEWNRTTMMSPYSHRIAMSRQGYCLTIASNRIQDTDLMWLGKGAMNRLMFVTWTMSEFFYIGQYGNLKSISLSRTYWHLEFQYPSISISKSCIIFSFSYVCLRLAFLVPG